MSKPNGHRMVTMRLGPREFQKLEAVREQLQRNSDAVISRTDVVRHFLNGVYLPNDEQRTG